MADETILVIDDEPDNITFVKSILGKEGFTVTSARDGIEGLKKAMEELPDLIVLDLQMPRMNGFEAFNRLRTSEITRKIPIVMLTGIRQKTGRGFSGKDIKAFYGEAPNGYVEKPISPDSLLKVVKDNL